MAAPMLPNVFDDQRIDWSRLRLANVTQTGANAIQDPADPFADVLDAQGNQYIEGTLLGGTATQDPGDAVWWTWRAADILGLPRTATELWAEMCTLRERVAPALATDSYVVVGLSSEANLASATVDAWGVGLVYTGAARTLRAVAIVDGGVVNASPAGNDAIRRVYSNPSREGGLNVFGANSCSGGTDAGGDLGSSLRQALNIPMSAGDLHVFLAFGRTAATAGVALIGTSAFAVISPPPRQGRLPL